MASDGNVVISTALDNGGIEKDAKKMTGSLRSQIMKLAHEFKKQGMSMSEAMKKAYAEICATGEKSTTQMSDDVSGTLGGLGNMVKKIGVAIAAAFSVRAIASFAKECMDLGSDLQEVQNVVDVTFTTMNEQVNEFAKNAAQTAGLSEKMAKQYAGTFGAMAKSFKFTEAEAYEMSTALTQLAGDVASFYNLTQDEAYTKLKSVFTGETESLKDLGVVMTQAALDTFALEKGLGKTTSQMTEQEKVALRYQFVMEQLSGASGDFIRTSDSWANQTRLLTLQFDQLKATLGQGFINILTPVVQIINTIISKLQDAADAFLAFTNVLFGDAGGSTGAVVENVSDGLGIAANNAEALEESAQKAKRALAGFDELNVLQEQADSAESGAGSGIIGTGSGAFLGTGESPLTQIKEDSSEIEEYWTNIAKEAKGFMWEVVGKVSVRNLENYKAAVDNLKSGWENLLSTITGGEFDLSEFIADIFDMQALNIGGQAKMLGGFLDLIAEYRRYYAELSTKSAADIFDYFSLNAIFEDPDVWDALGEITAGWGMSFTALLPESGAFGLSKEELENLFLPITEEYTNLYKDLSAEAAEALSGFTEVIDKLKKKTRKLDWSKSVITEDDVAEVEALTAEMLEAVVQANQDAQDVAAKSVNDLWENGLIDDNQRAEMIASLENTHAEQEALVTANKDRINEILNKAKDEKRALTAEENAEILSLITAANDASVAVITQGASDTQDVYEALEENRGKMSKQMLSETIQFANDEYDAKVKAAKEEYDTAIQNANTLYHDLGVIDEAEYERICTQAKESRDAQVAEAEQAKADLIRTAQEAAGGVAEAVDPETGEILSNWEILWNDMFTKVNEAWRDIKQTCKDFINAIIDFLNTPADTINSWSSALGGKSFFGMTIPSFSLPKIPKLAQGAVIPPNREFLAVLGDQKHGTNIEAPLATIQEAVRAELGETAEAIIAAAEAVTERQERILAAIEAIEVGDTTIGQAANRYNRKMAIIKGGL